MEHKAFYMGQAGRMAGEVCAGWTLEADAGSGAAAKEIRNSSCI